MRPGRRLARLKLLVDPRAMARLAVADEFDGPAGGGGGGGGRARSQCRFALPLIHFIPDSLKYSVRLFEKRQCDRTLGGGWCGRRSATGWRRWRGLGAKSRNLGQPRYKVLSSGRRTARPRTTARRCARRRVRPEVGPTPALLLKTTEQPETPPRCRSTAAAGVSAKQVMQLEREAEARRTPRW